MTDLIERQAAIEIVDRYDKSHMILKGKPMLGAASIVIELEALPSAQPEPFNDGYSGIYVKEEDVLKFYYVESEDDYWIGRRLDNFYYATWDRELQNFVWSKSQYLPWGEHIIAPDTLWKEYTYPSEPKEIPLKDWLKGFYAKYFMPSAQRTGEWILGTDTGTQMYECSACGGRMIKDCYDKAVGTQGFNYCPYCGSHNGSEL